MALEPVKLITGTSAASINRRAPSEPDSLKMFTAPAGSDGASAMIRATMALVCAVCPGIFTTVVVPAASAGARERIISTTGEFHGTMMPATPIGSRSTSDTTSGRGVPLAPRSLRARPA